MKPLVAYYGSDSDDDQPDEGIESNTSPIVENTSNNDRTNALPDDFFENVSTEKGGNDGGMLGNLPSKRGVEGRKAQVEGELEDFLIMRDWEKKLAEKVQKKQEKTKKKRIDAFGALRLNVKEENIDENDHSTAKKLDEPTITFDEKPKCSLLSILPKPKTESSKPATLMVPSVVCKPKSLLSMKREAPKLTNAVPAKRSLVQVPDSDSDDESIDFFGLSSASTMPAPELPETSVSEVPVFLDEIAPGPSRPTASLYSQPEEESLTNLNMLSDDAARKLIYEKELMPWGYLEHEANDAVSNIVDVSVDRALGPNIRENLLKNLNNKSLAQVTLGPLPKVKKDPADKLAKRKHQITYLANQAVAREEQLAEQWSQNKQKKRMAAQKYGF